MLLPMQSSTDIRYTPLFLCLFHFCGLAAALSESCLLKYVCFVEYISNVWDQACQNPYVCIFFNLYLIREDLLYPLQVCFTVSYLSICVCIILHILYRKQVYKSPRLQLPCFAPYKSLCMVLCFTISCRRHYLEHQMIYVPMQCIKLLEIQVRGYRKIRGQFDYLRRE